VSTESITTAISYELIVKLEFGFIGYSLLPLPFAGCAPLWFAVCGGRMQIVLLALLAVCVPIAFCGYVYLSANDRVQLKQLHLAKETVGKVRATAAAAAVFVVRARALCVCVCGGGGGRGGVRARARTERVCEEWLRSAGCDEFVGARWGQRCV
jgi:hypothetical protein